MNKRSIGENGRVFSYLSFQEVVRALICTCLSILMVLSLVPAAAFAESPEESPVEPEVQDQQKEQKEETFKSESIPIDQEDEQQEPEEDEKQQLEVETKNIEPVEAEPQKAEIAFGETELLDSGVDEITSEDGVVDTVSTEGVSEFTDQFSDTESATEDDKDAEEGSDGGAEIKKLKESAAAKSSESPSDSNGNKSADDPADVSETLGLSENEYKELITSKKSVETETDVIDEIVVQELEGISEVESQTVTEVLESPIATTTNAEVLEDPVSVATSSDTDAKETNDITSLTVGDIDGDNEEDEEPELSAEEQAAEEAEFAALDDEVSDDSGSDELSNLLNTDDVLDAQKDFTSVVRQSEAYTCGPASLATLLTNIGEDTSEAQVLEHIKVLEEERGTTLAELFRSAEALGFSPQLFSASAERLRDFVTETGTPVLIHDEKEGVGGHFSVVRGFEDGMVQLADTEAGNIQYSFGDFQVLYQGSILLVSELEIPEEFTILSLNKAEEIWGMYVPVAEAAGEFSSVQNSVRALQRCQESANKTYRDNTSKRNHEKRKCYADFSQNLRLLLTAEEMAEFIGNALSDNGVIRPEEVGSYALELHNEAVEAENRYLSLKSTRVATEKQLEYRKRKLEQSLRSQQGETQRLKLKLGSYEKAIASESVKLKSLSKALERSVSRSDKSSNYRLERELRSAESRLKSYESRIDRYKEKIKKYSGSSVRSSSSSSSDKYVKKAERYKQLYSKYKSKYREYRKKSRSKAKKYKKKYRKYYSSYKKYRKYSRKSSTRSSSSSSRVRRYEQKISKYERYARSQRQKVDRIKSSMRSSSSGDPALARQVQYAQLKMRLNEVKAQKTKDEIERKENAIQDQRDAIRSLERSMALQKNAEQALRAERDEAYREWKEAEADYKEEKDFILKVESEVLKDVGSAIESVGYNESVKESAPEGASHILSLIPVVGEGYDVLTLISGKDPVTKEELGPFLKAATFVGLASGAGSGKLARAGANKAIAAVAKKYNVSEDVAMKIVDDHFEKFWGVRTYNDAVRVVKSLSPEKLLKEVEAAVIAKVGKETVKAADLLKSRFADEILLRNHFLKHSKRLKIDTIDEYAKRASDIVNSQQSETLLKFVRSDGDTITFDKISNEFAVVSDKGIIRTYFIPDPDKHKYLDNLQYFYAQTK